MKGVLNLNIEAVVKENLEVFKAIRKELHENAELSFKEYNTSDIIKKYLNSFGLEVKTCFNTGVVGTLNNEKKCIGIRADMDALPVNGVSHACGHDFHMAAVLGTALVLKQMGFSKNVKFIFQPGEEDSGGALPMIKEGVLEEPEVEYMISLHVWPGLPVGKIEAASGPSMASVDDFTITFTGKGGHAAVPYLCRNPIYPAIELIQSFNNKKIIENDPLNPFIVTFASLNSGNACNVISDEAKIMGTVRTFDAGLRKKIKGQLIKTAELCAEKFGCSVETEYEEGYPPLINDKALAEKFIKHAEKILGHENVLPLTRSFTAEDFSFFAERVPSVHFRLGISQGEIGNEILHSSNFDGSDDSLYYAVLLAASFIAELSQTLE